jgi:hypothetical protein
VCECTHTHTHNFVTLLFTRLKVCDFTYDL